MEDEDRAKRIDIALAGAPLSKINREVWAETLAAEDYDERMMEWLGMLERRVAELDSMYLAYPWGRR